MASSPQAEKLSDAEAERKAEELYQEFMELPAYAKKIDPSKPLNAAFQGLQALKFEDDDPHLCASNYKDEGNIYFGKKVYDVAIANYDKALELEFDDSHLRAVLLTNRATSNFYLRNYRSCIKDCKSAAEHDPAHMKIYRRAALAGIELGKPKECLTWCELGLKVDTKDAQLLKIRTDAKQLEKEQKAERRRLKAKEWGEMKTQEKDQSAFSELLKARGLLYQPDEGLANSLPAELRVYEDDEGLLHWPVMFFYPEFGNTDLLRDVVESCTLSACVEQLFASDQDAPSWDPNRLYSTSAVEVYFENVASGERVRIPLSRTVKRAIAHPQYIIHAKLLTFIVVSKASQKFYASWVK